MANPIQWAHRRLQHVLPIGAINEPSQGSSLPFVTFGRNRISRLTSKHRIVVPCSERFKEEYENTTKAYKNNKIRTTKYTLLNFIPRNLFEQFHRAANLYFLFLVFLNWVPVVEAFQKEITMIPLLVVLTIIAIKDGLEDYRKHKLDKVINHLLARVHCRKEKKYVECYWKDVKVGNFIKLRCDEIIPADMVLLHSSDPDGICHIETSSLDGESNLKQRQVAKGYIMDCELDPEMFSSKIQCEAPNSDLGRFKGYLSRSDQEKFGLSKQNLLLRGCIVRNTEAVVGIVVYAGHDTKTMLNNSGPRYKRSQLERQLNSDILWCVLLLFIMCLFGALGYGIWLQGYPEPPLFILPEPSGEWLSPALAGFYMFWTMIIILQVLIPISLYVSIELVKLGQIFFIQNDKDFYCEKSDSLIECRALNICEDLGQVQYLFSDKTGTLTENKMVFRRCSIAGVEYSHEDNAKRLETYQESDLHPEDILDGVCSSKSATCMSKSHSPRSIRSSPSTRSLNKLSSTALDQQESDGPGSAPVSRSFAFSSPMEKDVVPDPGLLKKFSSITPRYVCLSSQAEKTAQETSYIIDFFLALAICNTVVVSLPNQPRQKVRMPSLIKTPMKSLEEIKQMFQKFSVRKLSSTSLSGGKDSCSETPNNFMNKVPLFSRMKLASPVEGDRTLEVSLDSTSEMPLDGFEKSDLASPSDATDKPTTCELYYEAESPDEAALVHAARAYKCTLQSRTPDQVIVELGYLGPLAFQLLHILPFDSVRKRMSVVVRNPLSNEVVVYTKGADSVIMDLLTLAFNDNKTELLQMEIRTLTQKHLDKYAKGGLRTLCIAKKVMTDVEYVEWLHGHSLAETSIDNREELLYESALKLETNLMLLGATGIEDRLQEGVPETIESLRKAGIKIWMLTGDKEETAVNIAYSCQLLEHSYKIFTLTRQERTTCEVLIDNIIDEIERHLLSDTPLTKDEKSHDSSFEKENIDFALIIDGKSLEFALHEALEKKFLYLAQHCRAVICCRMTPLQKSQVVKLVRNSMKVMTLAIGDGANDVSMIQVADVGVGISGQEGMQAVMSSDFAVSHFKHLRKLLLVHGHWCYTRLANMILYFFYKNVILANMNIGFCANLITSGRAAVICTWSILMFVNLLFWYQIFCGFSGTSMVDVWMLILFNLIFTSVPPIIYGVLDKDVSADTLLALPELYKSEQTSETYKKSTFWITILDAFYQSLACFFIPYFTYFGSGMDIYSFGNFIITATLFVVLLHLLIESKSMTWIHCTVMVLSIAAYFIFTLAVDAVCLKCMPPANPYWMMQKNMTDPMFYLVCVMSVVIALLPRFAFVVFQGTMFPTLQQRAKQLDVMSPGERSCAIQHWFLPKTDNTLFHAVPADGSRPTEKDEKAPCVQSPKESDYTSYDV